MAYFAKSYYRVDFAFHTAILVKRLEVDGFSFVISGYLLECVVFDNYSVNKVNREIHSA